MVEVHYLSGSVWVLGGIAMCGLGYLIGVRGRIELHSDYAERANREFASRWVGVIAICMGLASLLQGVREMLFGWDPFYIGALLVFLLVCSWLTKLIARGWTPRDGLAYPGRE